MEDKFENQINEYEINLLNKIKKLKLKKKNLKLLKNPIKLVKNNFKLLKNQSNYSKFLKLKSILTIDGVYVSYLTAGNYYSTESRNYKRIIKNINKDSTKILKFIKRH